MAALVKLAIIRLAIIGSATIDLATSEPASLESGRRHHAMPCRMRSSGCFKTAATLVFLHLTLDMRPLLTYLRGAVPFGLRRHRAYHAGLARPSRPPGAVLSRYHRE